MAPDTQSFIDSTQHSLYPDAQAYKLPQQQGNLAHQMHRNIPQPPFQHHLNGSPRMANSPQASFYQASANDPYGGMLPPLDRYNPNYQPLPLPSSPSLSPSTLAFFNLGSPWNGNANYNNNGGITLPPVLQSPSPRDNLSNSGNSNSNSFSPTGANQPSSFSGTSQIMSLNGAPFPESPQLLDASQMLMSPSRFRKRRHLSPLISGYTEPQLNSADEYHLAQNMASMMGNPPSTNNLPTTGLENSMQAALLRRLPTLKMPVSPTAPGNFHSPRQKPTTLVLPCYMNQENKIVPQGPFTSGAMPATAPGYWEETRRNAQAFLKEAEAIDEENVTIIEIKQLLRRYCISATGKKAVLMDRIRKLQAFFQQPPEESITNSAEMHDIRH